MIENVEELCAELNRELFVDFYVLGCRDIRVEEARTSQRIPPCIAECAGGLQGVTIRIEPQRHRPDDGLVVASRIRNTVQSKRRVIGSVIWTRCTSRQKSGAVEPRIHVERHAAVCAQNSADLPAFHYAISLER